MAANGERARQHALDGVRALCAFGVLMHHHAPDIAVIGHPFLQRLLGNGILALSPFFVMSGYLITQRYHDLRRGGVRAYLINRAARIFPLLFLVTTVAFIVHALSGTIAGPQLVPLYIANITTLKGWFDDLKFSGIVQTWSLAPEVAFYALAPLLFIGLRRLGASFLVLMPLCLLLIGLALVRMLHGEAPWGFMRSELFLFACTFFGRATEFAVGMAVAWYVMRTEGRKDGVGITLFGALATTVGYGVIAWNNWNYAEPIGVVLLNFLWPILGLGALLLGLRLESSMLQRLLSLPLMTVIGRSSYAFYLIHLGVVYSAFLWLTGGFVPTVALLLVTAWVLHVAFEEPIVRWAKRRWPAG